MVRHPGDFFGDWEVKMPNPMVPRLADRILHYLYMQDYFLERSGDLEEAFADLVNESGPFRAKVWLWFQILKLCCGAFLINTVWRLIMLKSCLKLAFRNMKRHKGYSAINILGLAVGFACTFMIIIFVQHELSYDKFHSKSDRIFRLLKSST